MRYLGLEKITLDSSLAFCGTVVTNLISVLKQNSNWEYVSCVRFNAVTLFLGIEVFCDWTQSGEHFLTIKRHIPEYVNPM